MKEEADALSHHLPPEIVADNSARFLMQFGIYAVTLVFFPSTPL